MLLPASQPPWEYDIGGGSVLVGPAAGTGRELLAADALLGGLGFLGCVGSFGGGGGTTALRMRFCPGTAAQPSLTQSTASTSGFLDLLCFI